MPLLSPAIDWFGRAALAAAVIVGATCVLVPRAQAAGPSGPIAMIVAVSVNGADPVDPVSILRRADGAMLISDAGLEQLRLRKPASGGISQSEQMFYPIDSLDGGKATFDDSTQTVNLSVAGSAFLGNSYDQHYVPTQKLDASATGGFLNYDLFYQNSQPAALSALLEGGAFFANGTLTSRFIYQDSTLLHQAYRLDTQFVRDYPEDTATLVIGDSISDSSAWSRSVYFGGIQWHTNFGTRPDLSALPLPSIAGTAAVPSTVDLYVDNVLRGRQQVDAGPFNLSNIPALTGQGTLMVVVRDPLGREQLFTQSYLSSVSLLKPGVYEDGFEVGALRENFGEANARYGPTFGSAQYRLGLDADNTMELHAEQSQGLFAAGAGLSRGLGTFGVATFGAAASHVGGSNGVLAYGQFDHQTTAFGASIRTQWSDPSFRQLGLGNGEATPKTQTQAQLSFSLVDGVSLLTGYTRQANREVASIQTLNWGLTWAAGRFGNIFAGLLRSFAPNHATSVNMVWTMPLGGQRYLQAAANRDAGNPSSSIEYDDSPPAELGWGVRLRRSFGDLAGDDIGGTYKTQIGDYSLAASNAGGTNTVQGEARGGFAIIGGHIIPTKWLDQSFALVTVPTSQPIEIYSNGVKVGATNHDGYGFVPNLVAYEPNHVKLDSANLPLQMTVELSTHDVTPRTRAGVIVEFTAERDNGARATLTYADGRPIETGAKVEIEAQAASGQPPPSDQIVVALRGNVYFPNIALPATLDVHTREGLCRVLIAKSANDDAIPNLGVLKCVP